MCYFLYEFPLITIRQSLQTHSLLITDVLIRQVSSDLFRSKLEIDRLQKARNVLF